MPNRTAALWVVFAVLLVWAVMSPGSSPILAEEMAPAVGNAGFTINVNTLVDEWSTDTATMASSKCSLREALQATGSGSMGNQGCGAPSISNFQEYTIQLMPGTYLLTRDEDMPNLGGGKKITIDGKGVVTIDGNSKGGRQRGIFHIASAELILIKIKLQHGWRPFGGALWLKGGSSAVVRGTEVEFYRNLADNTFGNGDGGAVSVDSGEFICVKCKFTENTARNAGGAVSGGYVLLDRAEFFRNHAEINGGALALYSGTEAAHSLVRDTIFRENWVYQTEVPADWPGQYKYTDDPSGGGALYVKGFVEIEKSQFLKNYTQRSKGGGAIYNQGEIRLTDVAISDNKARPDTPVALPLGGAILNDSVLVARRVSIHHNEASIGGAVMNRTAGRLFLANSTVAENLATSGGGLENGHNFLLNGAPAIDNGGEIDLYHATVVRNHDNNQDSTNVGNIVNGTVRMANSIVDSACAGTITTHGGNLFVTHCQRISSDNNNDLSQFDFVAQSKGELGLEGLTNNGGANLPEAEFLSVKAGDKAIDFARDEYCTDPALVPLFLMDKDQIGGARLVGPRCDAGAIEIGTLPPQVESQDPEGAGFYFPVTVFGKVWDSSHTFVLRNTGGGSVAWSLALENDAGGVYSVLAGPVSGGLGQGQEAMIELGCAPAALGWHEGMLVITTDQPGKETLRYPMSCKMITDPTNPSSWRNEPPGPVSAGQVPPGGQSSAHVQIGNQGVNPMNATVNLKDATADTIQFTATPGGVSAAGLAGPQVDLTIPQSGTVDIEITCAPPSPGLYTNILEITTNDPVDPLFSYNISCEGAFPPEPETISAVAKHGDLPAQRVMGLALSPDETQVVGGYWDGNRLIVYSANPASGVLSKQDVFSQPGMGTITGVRYSADGKNLYYSSAVGDGVGVASRAADGTLTAQQTISRTTTYVCGVISTNPLILKFCAIDSMDGARALDISPDDKNLYVTGINDHTLTVLRRNPETGALSYMQKFTATIDGNAIMTSPFGVIVSPEGRNVYVASRSGNRVIAFSRNPNDGRLSYLGHFTDEENGVTGLDGALELAISPDGRFLYALGFDDGAVQIFARDPADGYLTPVEAVDVGDGPYHVLTSNDPEGARLLVALWTGDAIKSYARDRLTGKLTPLGDPAGEVLDGPVFMVTTGDDRHVYASLYDGKGVQHLRSQRQAPLLHTLSPASVPVGSGDVTLLVNGERFYDNSTVLLNGNAVATDYRSPRQLRATVPAALLASAGSVDVRVRTAAPGGGDSAVLPLAVLAANALPIPSVAGLNPPAITLTGEPLNVVVTGAGFTPQSRALLNGAAVDTVYVSETMLLLQLAAGQVASPGPLVVAVINEPEPVTAAALSAESSTPVRFTVADGGEAAQPAIGKVTPASMPAGSGEQWVEITGYNFSAQGNSPSVVNWNGVPRDTVVLGPRRLAVRILASDVAAAGTAQISIYTPGAGASDATALAVLPAGQNPVAQLDTAYFDLSGPQLVASGGDFVDGAVVQVNGAARTTTYVNANVLLAEVSVDDLKQGGLVQVANPGAAASDGVVIVPNDFIYMPLLRR